MPSSRILTTTGGSKGIGRPVADRLAAHGHQTIGLIQSSGMDFSRNFDQMDRADRAGTEQTMRTLVGDGRIDAVVDTEQIVRVDGGESITAA